MENKDREIHIWHDNSGSDNYDLFFDIEDPNETAPSVLLLHCHEDEANYKERWQMELAGTSFVQQLVNTERDRAVARENQIEGELNNCCQEVKGRLDTDENNIAQNQTHIQQLQTDMTTVQGDVTNLHTAVNGVEGRVSANETNIVSLQRDVQNAQNTANTASTTAQQAQQVANDASTTAQQAQTTANAVSSTAQQAQQAANNANTAAQQAQTTANAVGSLAQQTVNEVHGLQNQLQQSNQTITDLQSQIQGLGGVWDYVPYFYKIVQEVNTPHESYSYDLTSWINTFPDSQQIITKLSNDRYRLFINYIRDDGKPVLAYINSYNYDPNTKHLTVEYNALGHVTFCVTLMTN